MERGGYGLVGLSKTQNGRLLSCHLPTPRETLEGRAARPWYHPRCRILPGHSFGVCCAWAPPTSAYLHRCFLRRAAPGRVPRRHRHGASTFPHSLSAASRVLFPVIAGVFNCATDANTRSFLCQGEDFNTEHTEDTKTAENSRIGFYSLCALCALCPLCLPFLLPGGVSHPRVSGRIGQCGAEFRRRGRRGCIPARSSRRIRCRAVRGRRP